MDRVGKGIRGTPRDAIIAAVSHAAIRGASFGLRKSLDTLGGFIGPLVAVAAMLALAGNIQLVFWLAAIPAALCMVVLIFFVKEPAGHQAEKKINFRLSEAFRLNRSVWVVIGLAALIMLARLSEAFVLLKALEAGISPAWVPLSLVIMHAAYGLTAYPVGRISDQIGTRGLLLCGLSFLIAAHLTLAFATSVWLYVLGTVFWGLHMGFSQGLLGAMIAGATPAHLRGSAFGSFNLITGLVVLAGNTAAGFLWHSFGSHVPFVAGAVLSLVAMMVLAVKGQPAK
ncbi:MFS transporter [Pseudogemmobacter sp. CC-YST710]|uniref:MFS transporter n=2 Tax=Pseudogemmobacter faecipullorum TaxID=2755041 RepID=A0ABS8CSA5_9RHOB|nr:MFS transporter [Pseudogemmobacter faecipullorum]